MQKLIWLALGIFLLSSCEKTSNNCTAIRNAKAHSTSPVAVGQTLKIWTDEIDGTTYSWTGPFNFTSQYNADSITDAKAINSGWYYLHVNSLDNDCSKTDSVYVEVTLQQGTAPCTIANNNIMFSNLPDYSFTTVTKHIESTYSLKALTSSTWGSDLAIYFSPYWRDHEPQDGIYTTYNSPAFDPVDPILNRVTITCINSSIYFSSWPDQQVYVSHENGKLRVQFCSLNMSGSNGTSYTTIADGNFIETP